MLRDVLDGWSRTIMPDGLLLEPPDAAAGWIRVLDREPPRPVRAIVASLAAGLPAGATFELTEPPRPLVTDEGEHAARFACRVRLGERSLDRQLGVVIGDEHFTIIDGRVEHDARRDAFRAAVDELTRGYCLGLGAARWRRFFYQPPRGWQGLARVRAEAWIPPSYPTDPSLISVFRARPAATTEAELAHRWLYELATQEFRPTAPPRPLAGPLPGFSVELVHGDQVIVNVALEDDAYIYPVRLHTDTRHLAAAHAMLDELLASVRPVPRARVKSVPVSHWIE